MYNNPYMQNMYNPQANIDRINNQIAELEKLKSQIPQQPMQPTNLTQNFQIAPTNHSTMKYANSIDEIQKEFVIGDTPYFSKDMSVVWIKNPKGEIKSYELNEIIPKDSKDIQIEYLQTQIEELKGMMKNEQSIANVDAEQIATNTATDDNTNGTPIKKSESTSIQKVSRSKKE